jgi:hypothetical protein
MRFTGREAKPAAAFPQGFQLRSVILQETVAARWLALIVLLAAACSGGSEVKTAGSESVPSRSSLPPACDAPTPLTPTPASGETAPGAHVGPLWFVFGGKADRAEAKLYPDKRGLISPSKVPIVVRERLPVPVTLRGWRCRDNTPLHFWYHRQGEVPLPRNPASPEELERAGNVIATLSGEPTIPGVPAYHGDFLFSAVGKWVVSVAVRDSRVGSLVVKVTAE